MNNFIFENKQQTSQNDKTKNLEEYYCLRGNEDYQDDEGYPRCKTENSDSVCAKKTLKQNNTYKYLIRTGDDRKLFNPKSIYDSHNAGARFLKAIRTDSRTFKEVGASVFSLYLSFLKTGNTAYLHNAEREM